MKTLFARITAAVTGLALTATLSAATPRTRVRLINSAPYDSILSLKVNDRMIASLVPQGETRHFKKIKDPGYCSLEIIEGLSDVINQGVTLAPGYDVSILPYLNAQDKPDFLPIYNPPADKKDSAHGLVTFAVVTPDQNGQLEITVDNTSVGSCNYFSSNCIGELDEGMHTIGFWNAVVWVQLASEQVYIRGGSNNVVVLSGTFSGLDDIPLSIHAYNDQSKF